MAKGLGVSVLVLAAALTAACAHRAPRTNPGALVAAPYPGAGAATVSSPSRIRIRALDDVPLGVYERLSRDDRGFTEAFLMERQGNELRLWARRPSGEPYVRHRLTSAADGRFAAQEIGSAWFVRDGDDVLLGFSGCYIEGPLYRWRR